MQQRSCFTSHGGSLLFTLRDAAATLMKIFVRNRWDECIVICVDELLKGSL